MSPTSILQFTGFIKNISYVARLTRPLVASRFDDFDINIAPSCGLLTMSSDQDILAYSKWVSPKRTRSYPFERIYNTYNQQKCLTIIPIIKDEGIDGDLDKIQYSTISWMNLLNIYIVLAYYDRASKNTRQSQLGKQKLTNQRFDSDFVNAQISEIASYKLSALHWNKHLIESRFLEIFDTALGRYGAIADSTGIPVHTQQRMRAYAAGILEDFATFKDISHRGSERASSREAVTEHRLEYLTDGAKAQFFITNYLGGIYYLTADEVLIENGIYIIQESKNATNSAFPAGSDIKDGLFKLILFSNLDRLELEGVSVPFKSRLKLTGTGIQERLRMPCSSDALEAFLKVNASVFKKSHHALLNNLLQETLSNQKLEIEIAPNE